MNEKNSNVVAHTESVEGIGNQFLLPSEIATETFDHDCTQGECGILNMADEGKLDEFFRELLSLFPSVLACEVDGLAEYLDSTSTNKSEETPPFLFPAVDESLIAKARQDLNGESLSDAVDRIANKVFGPFHS